jgi:hypothetical protein
VKKTVIFGAGDLGQCLYNKIKDCFEILFFVDNSNIQLNAPLPVFRPPVLKTADFDVVYIASASGLEEIYSQLVSDMGIPKSKINRVWSESHQYSLHSAARIRFLEDFAEYCYLHHIEGNCAEVGVYQGTFAKEINRVFSDKKLFLFDTFQGFDSRDLAKENENNPNHSAICKWVRPGGLMDFSNTAVETVLEQLPFPEQVIIKKGFFPETFDLNNNERFIFVSLDTDLYKPIKDGLEMFYPLMAKGGVILVHDYYSMLFGVTKAVDEFTCKNSLSAIPVGDYKSIAIIKS